MVSQNTLRMCEGNLFFVRFSPLNFAVDVNKFLKSIVLPNDLNTFAPYSELPYHTSTVHKPEIGRKLHFSQLYFQNNAFLPSKLLNCV